MKLSVMSDLHLEFDRGNLFVPEFYGEDVLILAGDIQMGLVQAAWFVELLKTRNVIYILGNHEFYKNNIDKVYDELAAFTTEVNDAAKLKGYKYKLFSLQNDSVLLDGITFVGATLWTDFGKENPVVLSAAPYYMNDYKHIRQKETYSKLTPERILYEHYKSRRFLEQHVKDAVVITHHLPSERSVDPRFKHETEANYFYYSELDYLVEQAKKWIHGHTHASRDYANIICNPRGYNGENINFKPTIVEI